MLQFINTKFYLFLINLIGICHIYSYIKELLLSIMISYTDFAIMHISLM